MKLFFRHKDDTNPRHVVQSARQVSGQHDF